MYLLITNDSNAKLKNKLGAIMSPKLPSQVHKGENKTNKLLTLFLPAYDRLNYKVAGLEMSRLHIKQNISKPLLLRICEDQYGSIIHWLSHEFL